MKKQYVALHSGGLDSTVLVWHLCKNGMLGGTMTIDYGQRNVKELDAVDKTLRLLPISRVVRTFFVDLREIASVLMPSALTGKGEIPENLHYSDDAQAVTVVPNRNMVFISLAAAHSVAEGHDGVAVATQVEEGKETQYPDARPEFTDAMDQALLYCDYREQHLFAPFKDMSKSDIIRLGRELNVPLSETWSCYKNGLAHCGRCGACVKRKEAFQRLEWLDTTEYLHAD